MKTRLLEVCVDDARGLEAAISGGADRIELCSALGVGGLTPSPGLMAIASAAPVPVYAMIRPRAGSFVFGPTDLDQMKGDIEAVRHHGLKGIVIGASLGDGRLDCDMLKVLLQAGSGLAGTLHRAIDLVPDFDEALEQAVHLGFERILTSGGARTALEGLSTLKMLSARARGRIEILPGSGINLETVGPILEALPDTEIHASCSIDDDEPAANVRALGFVNGSPRRTDAQTVRALKARISA